MTSLQGQLPYLRSLAVTFLLASAAFAGGTPDPGTATSAGSTAEDQLLHAFGEARAVSNGDFVASTSTGALNDVYELYVEVPPGQSRLVVELFDADVGAGSPEYFDGDKTGFVTPATYRLYDPSGSEVVEVTYPAQGCAPCDNAWTGFYDTDDAPPPAFEGGTTAVEGSNGSSLAVPVPAGTTSGDLLLAAVAVDNNNGMAAISTPAGWTAVDEGNSGGGGGAIRFGVFYRVAGASEPASYTFAWGSNQEAAAAMLRYSGVDGTNPIDAAAVDVDSSNSPTAPSVTTTVGNTRVVRLFGADDDDVSAAVHPPQLDGRFAVESSTSGGTCSAAGADSVQAPAGATGSVAFDLDGTGSEQWRAVTVALRPAPVTPGPASVTPGHWRLEVDSTGTGSGEDGNVFGVRAYDGDVTSGGTEYNVYAHSYLSLGESSADYTTNREYHLYPYVTRGCTVDVNDFDGDGACGFDLETRSGSSQLASQGVSDNNQWANVAVTGWTDDDEASDYGLWELIFNGSPSASGNNVYVLYAGSEATADPTTSSPFGDPSAQPEPDTHRIYLPADGSSYSGGSGTINAPVKPYLTQYLTHVAGSGPNPPTAGTTTEYALTAQAVNPAAFPIAFDASTAGSNVVTVFVPTSDPQISFVTGSIVTTQGSASTTTTGGGDTIVTWAPGTVAAAATEAVFFRVEVTPSAPFTAPITVTGTPSANGTEGTFVDETCATASPACTGSQLTAATLTFGPLCELRVSHLATTPALVSSFRAAPAPGGAVVEWRTAVEGSTAGFDLFRLDADGWRSVGSATVPPLFGALQGGVYRLLDDAAPSSGRVTYLLAEHDALGRERYHGPFEVTLDEGGVGFGDGAASGFSAAPHPVPEEHFDRVEEAALDAAAAEAAGTGLTAERRPLRWKLAVREPGLHRVRVEELAAAVGEPAGVLRDLLRGGRLELSRLGEPVAWSSAGEALTFYAEALDSPYTGELVYRLGPGRGLGFGAALGGGVPGAPVAIDSFRDRVDAEENLRPVTLLPLDPEGDVWFWDFVTPGGGDKSFEVAVPHPDPGGAPALLTVRLQGGAAGSHRLAVAVNGRPVGEVAVSDLDAASPAVPLDAGLLADGVNVVELTSVDGGLVFVDGFDVDYDRRRVAVGDRLAFPGDGTDAMTVGGFSGGGVTVVDVTDPRRPRLVPHAETKAGDEVLVTLGRTGAGRRYLASGTAAVASPAEVRLDRSARLASPEHRADYLVITTAGLADAAEALADLRRGSGLEAKMVLLEEVYDDFSDGVADPRAIRDFLAYAHARWAVPPRYVVLAGAGTFDYRDYLGLGGNLIPPLLVARDDSVFATDAPYADVVGDDGAPELALGRIPALTAAELRAYVDKLAAYEAGEPSAEDELLLVTDRADAAGDFGADGDRLARLVPGDRPLRRVDYQGDLPAARAELFDAWADGPPLALYLGHGGVDRLSSAGLLTIADVPSLPVADRPPVLAAVSCHVALHALPGFDALGEHLLLAPAGTVGVWAPVWLSQHPQAIQLGEELLRQTLHRGERHLGEAARRTLATGAAIGLPRHLLYSYQLLGDPALELQLADGDDGDVGGPCTVDCDVD